MWQGLRIVFVVETRTRVTTITLSTTFYLFSSFLPSSFVSLFVFFFPLSSCRYLPISRVASFVPQY